MPNAQGAQGAQIDDAVARAVREAIEETNAMLEPGKQIAFAPQTPLLGSGGLDSLTLINLVVALEEQLETATGATLSLADRLGNDAAAFATIGSLVDYLGARLQRTGA